MNYSTLFSTIFLQKNIPFFIKGDELNDNLYFSHILSFFPFYRR
ncbi:hypothetical protein HMPREF0083_06020 [Aneurinibacillus aneurinilyticus ATCC 12856]|uniref:Uncharacterized protein n=1 Tax=Aneurinibacillus aneurinilyticus ATCC 12856 TaxID=649747 RepID=U1WQD3_ANEAE|nr:hypothetical protein HMPREF0083_06020 [Aneurinibacillus aneurinilyticus ATCC 12856]